MCVTWFACPAEHLKIAHLKAIELLRTLGTADTAGSSLTQYVDQHWQKLPVCRFTSQTLSSTAALLKAAFDQKLMAPASQELKQQVRCHVSTPACSTTEISIY